MTLLGLDLDAGRARAVGDAGAAVALDPPWMELLLAASLEPHGVEVGRVALRRCRTAPHLVRTAYLAQLGAGPSPAEAFRAEDALAAVFLRARGANRRAPGAVLTVPPYLGADQVRCLFQIADGVGLPLLGCVASPLALASGCEGPALVVECDDFALTLSAVAPAAGQLRLLATRSLPTLGLHVWRERVVHCLAERCILERRIDPRDSPTADQDLYERCHAILAPGRRGSRGCVTVRAPHWEHEITLGRDDLARWCRTLVRRAMAEVEAFQAAPWALGPPRAVFLSAAAGALPGLVEVLGGGAKSAPSAEPEWPEDFGEGLLDHEGETPRVTVLPVDAAARSAQALAERIHRGELPAGHFPGAVPGAQIVCNDPENSPY